MSRSPDDDPMPPPPQPAGGLEDPRSIRQVPETVSPAPGVPSPAEPTPSPDPSDQAEVEFDPPASGGPGIFDPRLDPIGPDVH